MVVGKAPCGATCSARPSATSVGLAGLEIDAAHAVGLGLDHVEAAVLGELDPSGPAKPRATSRTGDSTLPPSTICTTRPASRSAT